MTVSYSRDVSTSHIANLLRLLLKWRGSVFKLLWKDLIVYLGLYFALSAVYRFALNEQECRTFEGIAKFCSENTGQVPLIFLLGFYVSRIVDRWWQNFLAIPWMDKLALYVGTYVEGHDIKGRLLRRTIIRYANLSTVLGLRTVSSAIVKRFPTLEHLIEAGFLTIEELELIEQNKSQYTMEWIPCAWAMTLLHGAYREGRTGSPVWLWKLTEEVNSARERTRLVWKFDWISIPLVYTQVVTMAVYTYFLACLLGSQFIHLDAGASTTTLHAIFPYFTVLQFMFYMGWLKNFCSWVLLSESPLKVAETHMNPFGEDDDDFEVNFIIERNLKISYEMVEKYASLPSLQRDCHWDKAEINIPHTAASYGLKDDIFLGSAENVEVSQKDAEIVINHPEFSDTGLYQQPESAEEEQQKADAKIWRRYSKPLSVPNNLLHSTRRQTSCISNNSSFKNYLLRKFSNIGGDENPIGLGLDHQMSNTISTHLPLSSRSSLQSDHYFARSDGLMWLRSLPEPGLRTRPLNARRRSAAVVQSFARKPDNLTSHHFRGPTDRTEMLNGAAPRATSLFVTQTSRAFSAVPNLVVSYPKKDSVCLELNEEFQGQPGSLATAFVDVYDPTMDSNHLQLPTASSTTASCAQSSVSICVADCDDSSERSKPAGSRHLQKSNSFAGLRSEPHPTDKAASFTPADEAPTPNNGDTKLTKLLCQNWRRSMRQ